MGKTTDDDQNPPASGGGGGGGESSERDNAWWRFSERISSLFGFRCLLVLTLSVAVFLSAFFWLPPFLNLADRRDSDLDPRYRDHEIVASFNVEKPASFLNENIFQLEKDIFDEMSYASIKVVIISIEPSNRSNITKVVFGIDPTTKFSEISPLSQSSIRESFEALVTNQSSLQLTKSLFGEPFLFEVLKFPGGITVIPTQRAFLLQKVQILFNFTLNFSIYQIQTNFNALTSQLKKGLHLAPYENLYLSLSNSEGSTVSPPTTVHSSVLLAVGNTPSMPRLKQLAQTITGSHSRNLGLNNTVFGMVKQVRFSSILQHSLHGNDGSDTSPSPSSLPHIHHHHHHHHYQHHHHHQNAFPTPEMSPTPSTEKGALAPLIGAPAPPGFSLAPQIGAPAPTGFLLAPQKSYNAKPPACRFGNKRRQRRNSAENHSHLAPRIAPNISRHFFIFSPKQQLHPPAPTPAKSRLVPASSPLPHVAFAHAQPPPKSESDKQHSNEMASISPPPSPCSPAMQGAAVLFLFAEMFHV